MDHEVGPLCLMCPGFQRSEHLGVQLVLHQVIIDHDLGRKTRHERLVRKAA